MVSSRRVAVVGLLAVMIALASGAGVALADDDHGSGLGVTITDGTPSPTPSPTSSQNPGGGTGGGGNGGDGGGGGSSTPPPGPTPSPTPTGDGTDGWIVVSGLDSSSQSMGDPFGGWMHVVVSVANRSATTPVSGSVVFRMFTVFGNQIGPAVTNPIDDIPAGEVRMSTATLPGVGQWTFLRVSAEFTPRGVSDDADPISRDTWVFVFPWLLAIVVLVVVAALVIRHLRQRSARAEEQS